MSGVDSKDRPLSVAASVVEVVVGLAVVSPEVVSAIVGIVCLQAGAQHSVVHTSQVVVVQHSSQPSSGRRAPAPF